ncbi:MAG: thiamine-phosphate pyrophosphorylase [Candidatus Goldbacteria bacterium]|nr:thiamine-phosphate pyrophosphorylase [Candidatus Goldiibacteriota bacterium]
MALKIKKNILSIIDANINRTKEGLRVIEDIIRFVYKNKKILSKIKNIRHSIDNIMYDLTPEYKKLLYNRNSLSDTGRKIKNKEEFKRENLLDILIANFKRTEESLRVLEEISKILNKSCAIKLKDLRYNVYEIEKKIVLNI